MCRILCTADVHVGRSSSVGDEELQDHSALAAWERIVDAAIDGSAQAVVIAGDFFDSLPAQYVTRSRVRRAFERLRDQGIQALAVAGNHDCSALPAFVQAHERLVHLFPDERWDSVDIAGIHVVGRSFGREYQYDSMLRGFNAPHDHRLTVGLVDADIEGQGCYGPTPLEHFRSSGVGAWVAGHVHAARRFLDGQVIYPGSPQSLDWGEAGEHGFCWLEIKNGTARFGPCCPLSSVRYEQLEFELSAGEPLEVRLQEKAEQLRQGNPYLASVQFRVDLRLRDGAPEWPTGETTLGHDRYTICSTTRVRAADLKDESQHSDARGQAARLLLGLDGQGNLQWQEKARSLVEQIRRKMDHERARLNLPGEEDVRCLRCADIQEAHRAVRRVLESVLAAEGGVR